MPIEIRLQKSVEADRDLYLEVRVEISNHPNEPYLSKIQMVTTLLSTSERSKTGMETQRRNLNIGRDPIRDISIRVDPDLLYTKPRPSEHH